MLLCRVQVVTPLWTCLLHLLAIRRKLVVGESWYCTMWSNNPVCPLHFSSQYTNCCIILQVWRNRSLQGFNQQPQVCDLYAWCQFRLAMGEYLCRRVATIGAPNCFKSKSYLRQPVNASPVIRQRWKSHRQLFRPYWDSSMWRTWRRKCALYTMITVLPRKKRASAWCRTSI